MFAADSQFIRERVQSLWPGQQPQVQYTWADLKFDPPEGAAWVRWTIIPGVQNQV